MDEKTANLRELFLDVAEDSVLTERQEESRGSLVDKVEIDTHIRNAIETMRDRYEFTTSLSVDELVTVVKRFYAGDTDTEIARVLGDTSPQTVRRARLMLHLLTDADLDAPFPLAELRDLLGTDMTTMEIAGELDVSPSTIRRYKRVIVALSERRRVGDQFRAEFDRILQDRELSDQLTKEIRETGLKDATDGMETNVSF